MIMLTKNEAPASFATVSGAERLKVVRAAIDMHNLRYPEFTPIQFVDIENLEAHIATTAEQQGRQILLVKIQHHYLAVDVLKNGDEKTCVVLDAANDGRSYAVMQAFENRGFSTYMATSLSETVERNLQADSCSCALFSLDHCIQLSFEEPVAFHENAQNWSEDGGFTWDNLPINFLWNAQTNSFLRDYAVLHPEQMTRRLPNGMTADEYAMKGRLVDEDGDISNNAINQNVLTSAWEAYRLAELDRRYEKDEMWEDMQNTLEDLQDLGTIPDATLQQLTALQEQFLQSTEDTVQYASKQEFHNIVAQLEIPESSAQMVNRYRDRMQAGRGGSVVVANETNAATRTEDLEQDEKSRLS